MEFFERIARHTTTAVAVLVVSSLLLVSMGGAIIVAPLSLPLLYVVARQRPGGLKVWAGIVAPLTAAEVGWLLAYATTGEAQPLIWLLPLVTAVTTVVIFIRSTPTATSSTQPSTL